MRRIIFILYTLAYILATSSCQDMYYMPFKESDSGKRAASFYLDGEPFKTESDGDISTDKSDTKLSISFYCVSDLHTNSSHWIILNVSADEGGSLGDKDRYIVGHDATISIGRYHAEEGHITFRKMGHVISGNFEFSFQDEENNRHHVRYGNFDTK